MTCIVYATPASAMTRLEELGVAVEALQGALAAGHAARISTTDNDAPQIPGTYAWAAALRTLRDELCPKGWRKADPVIFHLSSMMHVRLTLWSKVVIGSRDSRTHRPAQNR